MADVFEFTDLERDETTYSDGTRCPHLDFNVRLNGEKVGRGNVHLHRHRGRDGVADLSFGATFVSYGPLSKEEAR